MSLPVIHDVIHQSTSLSLHAPAHELLLKMPPRHAGVLFFAFALALAFAFAFAAAVGRGRGAGAVLRKMCFAILLATPKLFFVAFSNSMICCALAAILPPRVTAAFPFDFFGAICNRHQRSRAAE